MTTITREEARSVVLRCLDEIAPGAEGLGADADLRVELDLDSMDVFNLVAAISEATGVDIPDRELGALTTVDAFVARLAAG